MMQYQIVNVRSGGEYSVIGCDVVLGYSNDRDEFIGVLTVRNVWLREKKDGNGYFVSWPSAARVKNGTVVKENGKAKYDNLIGLYGFEGANSKNPTAWAVAPAGWEFQEALVNDLLALSKTQSKVSEGRGAPRQSATPTRRARPASAAAARPAQESNDGDDDLPF